MQGASAIIVTQGDTDAAHTSLVAVTIARLERFVGSNLLLDPASRRRSFDSRPNRVGGCCDVETRIGPIAQLVRAADS